MKHNLVILAAVATLVFAAPAAAASKIEVSVSSPNPTLGASVTFQVSGEAEVGETYQVDISSESERDCIDQVAGHYQTVFPAYQLGNDSSINQAATIPIGDYNALGTYAVCAMVRLGVLSSGSFAESTTSFTVVAPPAPEPTPTIVAPAPAAVPVLAPAVTAPATTTHVTPVATTAQKLHAALAKCKRLKKHSKRVACEKRATHRYGPKPKRH